MSEALKDNTTVYKTIYEIEQEDTQNKVEYINPKTNEPYEMVAGLCIGKTYYSEKLGRGIILSHIDEEKGYVFTRFMVHIKMITWACKIEEFKKQFSPLKPNCFKGNLVSGFIAVDNYDMTKRYHNLSFNSFFKTPEQYKEEKLRHEQYEKEREEKKQRAELKKQMKENGTYVAPIKKPRHHNKRNNGKDTLKDKIKRHERVLNKKGKY